MFVGARLSCGVECKFDGARPHCYYRQQYLLLWTSLVCVPPAWASVARNPLYMIPLYRRNESSSLRVSNWSVALVKPTKITEMFTSPTPFYHQKQHTSFRNNTNWNIHNSNSNIIPVQWIKFGILFPHKTGNCLICQVFYLLVCRMLRILQTGHITLSSTPDQQLENHSTKYHRQEPLYNTLELLMMGIVVPETCWASNKICNKNLCCI